MKNGSLSSMLHFPATLSAVFRHIRRQRNFIDSELGDQLSEAKQTSDGTLVAEDFKKITGYYGLAVPAILGEAIAALRGEKITRQERLALTYQGAFTGLFDDFFDRHQMTEELLLQFVKRPEKIKASNSTEKLFLQFFDRALANFPNKELTIYYFLKVYEAQVESRKQAAHGLSKEEIKRITIDKGGYSVLFYRSVFKHSLPEMEAAAFLQMGGLMQLGNDIFDAYKDSLAGIETLITGAEHVKEVREIFVDQQKKSFGAFFQLGYPEKNVRRFLRLVELPLCSRCYVCLDQLEELEKKTGNRFKPNEYTRAELICDMDKWSNKWKTIRYFMRS